MDKPKCKLCGERHALGPCRFNDKIQDGIKEAIVFAGVEQTTAPPGQCPYCDSRRAKAAEAVRLHRARKAGKITP